MTFCIGERLTGVSHRDQEELPPPAMYQQQMQFIRADPYKTRTRSSIRKEEVPGKVRRLPKIVRVNILNIKTLKEKTSQQGVSMLNGHGTQFLLGGKARKEEKRTESI